MTDDQSNDTTSTLAAKCHLCDKMIRGKPGRKTKCPECDSRQILLTCPHCQMPTAISSDTTRNKQGILVDKCGECDKHVAIDHDGNARVPTTDEVQVHQHKTMVHGCGGCLMILALIIIVPALWNSGGGGGGGGGGGDINGVPRNIADEIVEHANDPLRYVIMRETLKAEYISSATASDVFPTQDPSIYEVRLDVEGYQNAFGTRQTGTLQLKYKWSPATNSVSLMSSDWLGNMRWK